MAAPLRARRQCGHPGRRQHTPDQGSSRSIHRCARPCPLAPPAWHRAAPSSAAANPNARCSIARCRRTWRPGWRFTLRAPVRRRQRQPRANSAAISNAASSLTALPAPAAWISAMTFSSPTRACGHPSAKLPPPRWPQALTTGNPDQVLRIPSTLLPASRPPNAQRAPKSCISAGSASALVSQASFMACFGSVRQKEWGRSTKV